MDSGQFSLWDVTELEPAYRVKQLHKRLDSGVCDPAVMTELPPALREELAKLPSGEPRAVTVSEGRDSRKFLFEYPGGARVEAALMRYEYGLSACLSSQSGCRMNCAFCASCANGLERDLTGGEILGQYAALKKLAGEDIPRVVLMGTGEPLDNLGAVLFFLGRAGISKRRVSVSTCGIVPGIRELALSGYPVTLSVSLHAPDDETRGKLMPVNAKYGVNEVMGAAAEYFRITGRRVSYEYILIDGLNDAPEHSALLARKLKGSGSHVNLIPYNPVPGKAFKRSRRVREFLSELTAAGINATVRRSVGGGIDAACGQLRGGTVQDA